MAMSKVIQRLPASKHARASAAVTTLLVNDSLEQSVRTACHAKVALPVRMRKLVLFQVAVMAQIHVDKLKLVLFQIAATSLNPATSPKFRK